MSHKAATKKPIVSVIIPTYNRERMVTQAIESVLVQSFKAYEIILVDDGSTDRTRQILDKWKDQITYIYQENQGGAAARNTGIKKARGSYVAFLDSDDTWHPNKLEVQCEILEKCRNIDAVYCNYNVVNEKMEKTGSGKGKFPSGFILNEVLLLQAGCGVLETLMVRMKSIREIGFFDETFEMAHDREFIVRLARAVRLYGIPTPLVNVRVHQQTPRLRTRPAVEKEYYWNRFLEKLFKESDYDVISKSMRRRLIGLYSYLSGLAYLKEYNAQSARRKMCLSLMNYPGRLQAVPYLLATMCGSEGLKVMGVFRKRILRAISRFRS